MPSAGAIPPAATVPPLLGEEVFFANTWYPLLCGFATFNIVLLIATVCLPDSQMAAGPKSNRRLQLVLAVPHIVGFALLTYMPIRAWQRFVWHKWTNVLIMRLVGCVAEVAWMTQLALALVYFEQKLLRGSGGAHRSVIVSQFMLAAVCVGEFLLVTGEVTRDSLWFIVGEALRALGFLLLIPPCIKLLCNSCRGARDPQLPQSVVQDSHVKALQGCCTLRVFIFTLMSFCLGYVAWVLLWAIRHYSADYDQQVWAKAAETLSIVGGLRDVLTKRNYTRDWHDWKPQVLWMALYFNLTSWASLMLVWPTVATKAARERMQQARGEGHDAAQSTAGAPRDVKDIDGDLEERKFLEQPLIAEGHDAAQSTAGAPRDVKDIDGDVEERKFLEQPLIAEVEEPTTAEPPADEGHRPIAAAPLVVKEEKLPPAAPEKPEPPPEPAPAAPPEPAEPEVPLEPAPPEQPAPVALPSPFAPPAQASGQPPRLPAPVSLRPQRPPVYFDPDKPFMTSSTGRLSDRLGQGRGPRPGDPDIPEWASRLYYNNPLGGGSQADWLPAAGSPAARSPRFGNRHY